MPFILREKPEKIFFNPSLTTIQLVNACHEISEKTAKKRIMFCNSKAKLELEYDFLYEKWMNDPDPDKPSEFPYELI